MGSFLLFVLALACLWLMKEMFSFMLRSGSEEKVVEEIENWMAKSEPVTKEQAAVLVDKILDAIRSRSQPALDAHIDYGVLSDRGLRDFRFGPEARARAAAGLKAAAALNKIDGGIFMGSWGRQGIVLRTTERDGLTAVTVRFADEKASPEYLDLLLARVSKDEIKMVDVYGHINAAYVSDGIKNVVLLAKDADSSLLQRVFHLKSEEDRQAAQELLVLMRSFVTMENPEEWVRSFESLPGQTRRLPLAHALYRQMLLAMKPGPERLGKLVAAVKEARQSLGVTSMIELVLVDAYIEAGKPDAAWACVEAARQEFGDDAILFNLMGMLSARMGDVKLARQLLQYAMNLEPGLIAYAHLKIMIHVLDKEYDKALDELYRFGNLTGVRRGTDYFDDPFFDEFKKTPEYQNWASLRGN